MSVVWATDAPTFGTTGNSKIKLMDLVSGTTLGALNTGGIRRVDELCFVTLPSGAPDPKHPYVMVANDDPLDNFLTIWRWDNFAFVQKIFLNGTDPYAAPYNTAAGGTKNAANGIEQCKFNPRNGYFYLAVPATSSNAITSFGTLTGGSSYTAGTYTNVPLTGGTGTGATANIIVAPTQIVSLGTLTGGTGYLNGGYFNTPLTGGTGTGATANIVITGNAVTTVTLVNPGSGYTVGDSLSASTASLGGLGGGFSIKVATLGGPVTTVTLVNPGSGYAVGNSLTATAASIGGTGSGFSILVATVSGGPTDGFVLKISLPVQSTPTTPPSTPAQHAKVVAAFEIFPGTGCVGPAGLSIGPSYTAAHLNGEIALGCGATGTSSLIIDDFGATLLPVGGLNGTDETWYDPATNHFFFGKSGTAPAFGSLGVVDANEYPPRSYVQEDDDLAIGGSPVQDTTADAATGSHSVAVFPGTCNLPSTAPTRLSRVYVPTRSTLTAGAPSTICSSNLGAFTPTGAAPQWPGGTAQAPTATTYDQWGCIAVFTAPATCTSTGHANPSP